jgi:hypothetical protein
VAQRIEDVWPACWWRLYPARRRRIVAEAGGCRDLSGWIAFARRWMRPGSVQYPEEIGAALEYLRGEAPRCVCEIGTAESGTTLLLSQLLPSVELVVGIDLFVKNRWLLERVSPSGQRMCTINGSSRRSDVIRQLAGALAGRPLDALLIDGDHRYAGVLWDFLIYRWFMREDGLILFHDIVPDYRARFGHTQGAWSGDVPLFWERLKPCYPQREFIRDSEQNSLGIGALRYRSAVSLPRDLFQEPQRRTP